MENEGQPPREPRATDSAAEGPKNIAAGAAWVAAAAGSGVLGNLAYDAAKAALVKLARRPKNPADHYSHDRVLIAKLAVQARCRELQWPVPERASMRVRRIDDEGVICLTAGKLTAHVAIASDKDEILVQLHSSKPTR
ncbi:hypothetical protein [Amycolatopsis sp. YIM 10]|uniref:hypothetical protein n=1 Tax=Amycolatopsis sp. YIM 10 TaxID=2653857 RepID=UPI0012906FA3|nr:hypothetical protein [Amycolatopsis sp. YIM 10]QFU86819.1 hypothetical protein YIM_08040 [Amycolatopsis sp. YIM 10]